MTDYSEKFSVEGKVAIVTGAARGIGAEVAVALAQRGASVLLTDVLLEEGQKTAASIEQSGGKAEFVQHDVTDETQWKAVVARAIERFGDLNVLVNNAGIETAALITQCELSDFQRVMDVNVTGVFLGHKHAIPVMKPGSSIINLSSVAGIIGTSAHVAYHTSKGAVRLMTKAAGVECAQLGLGIRVNSVHPAIVTTQMGSNFCQDFVDLGLAPDKETAEANIGALHPSGFGETQDIASAILFLSSDASRWMTGSELVVDGGMTAT